LLTMSIIIVCRDSKETHGFGSPSGFASAR
jgi:hypothetical protein